MRVSIVINNYNYGEFLRSAIDSALGQDYSNCEVVVVDDGSTDESAGIIKSYGCRLRSVLKENGGQASAFNAGIREASGEWVLFLDADDYLYPHTVNKCIQYLNQDIVQLQFWLSLVNETGERIGAFHPEFIIGDTLDCLARVGRFLVNPTSGNLFNRKALLSVFPLPESDFRICADALLISRISTVGLVGGVNEELAAYRVHGANNFFLARNSISDRDVEKVARNALLQRRVLSEALHMRGLVLPVDFALRSPATLEAIEIFRTIRRLEVPHGLPLSELMKGVFGKGLRRGGLTFILLGYAVLLRICPVRAVRWIARARRRFFAERGGVLLKNNEV